MNKSLHLYKNTHAHGSLMAVAHSAKDCDTVCDYSNDEVRPENGRDWKRIPDNEIVELVWSDDEDNIQKETAKYWCNLFGHGYIIRGE